MSPRMDLALAGAGGAASDRSAMSTTAVRPSRMQLLNPAIGG